MAENGGKIFMKKNQKIVLLSLIFGIFGILNSDVLAYGQESYQSKFSNFLGEDVQEELQMAPAPEAQQLDPVQEELVAEHLDQIPDLNMQNPDDIITAIVGIMAIHPDEQNEAVLLQNIQATLAAIDMNNIDVVDPNTGMTALHKAIQTEQLKLVQIIVALGADVNAQIAFPGDDQIQANPELESIIDFTPLHLAIKSGRADVALLLAQNPNVDLEIEANNFLLSPIYRSIISFAQEYGSPAIAGILRQAYARRGIQYDRIMEPVNDDDQGPATPRKLDFDQI